MRILVALFVLCFSVVAQAQNTDYGKFPASAFANHYTFEDTVGLSGMPSVDLYTNNTVSPKYIKQVYELAYKNAKGFLAKKYGYKVNGDALVKHIDIKILTIAQLNSPENFGETQEACMQGPVKACTEGCYIGRTFYQRFSGYITVYVAYSNLAGVYGFKPMIMHELMHVILYRYGWHYNMDESREHELISEFLSWAGEEGVAARTAKSR